MSGESDVTEDLTPWVESGSASQTGPRPLLAGRYEILGLLGQGGMGSVYKARDIELSELCALKLLRPDTPLTDYTLERFRREVKLARRVTHKNVARMYDIGEHQGTRFLTMELVDGESLSALLAREGKLAPGRATHIAGAVCEGLVAAHAAGVIHRDLKPDNVLLDKAGRIVITDFGIARAGEADSRATIGAIGTPAYMSPEQVQGGSEIDGRADLYALGVMLFEMLTGRMPFTGASPFAVASARLSVPPPDSRSVDASIPEWLSALVLRCMAQRPEDRPKTASEVLAELGASTSTLPEANVTRVAPLPSMRSPEAAAVTAPGEKTVAVLPFSCRAADDAYLAEGLTEDLVDTLSTTPGLKVRPLGMARSVAAGTDPREAGKALHVQVVVEGSLRRTGDAVRVSARVTSVEDGFQLWAKRFDRSAADLLVVSDEVAQSIAEALTVGAPSSGREALSDARAIELYLRGRAELRRLWETPVRHACQLLADAHRLCPDDPSILASYARARARHWLLEGKTEDGRTALNLAQRAIDKAPERGETWLALAQVRFVEGDFVSAAGLLRTALGKSRELAEAHELVGIISMEVGDLDQAIARLDAAQAFDPGLHTWFDAARALALAGRWDEADARLDQTDGDALTQAGKVALRARLALWKPDRETDLAVSEDLPALLPTAYARVAAHVLKHRSLSPQGLEFVEQNLAKVEDAAWFSAFKRELASELFLASGQKQRAELAITEAAERGLSDENWLIRCPALEPLRNTAAYEKARSIVGARAERVRKALAL
jgi:serine/threonine-protein kinase